jgi:hypothetical protein
MRHSFSNCQNVYYEGEHIKIRTDKEALNAQHHPRHLKIDERLRGGASGACRCQPADQEYYSTAILSFALIFDGCFIDFNINTNHTQNIKT